MNTKYKTPQRLKGFNDFFAEDMIIRQFVINTFKQTYEKFGYEPLETPALEYSELILGQSGEEAEKQYYRFNDQGGRDVMLKYEVMTAMCRAVAQNINNVPLPYKRYQIQPVWRAENSQKGRYREFTQCDADTIGTTSMLADAEFIQMGIEILGKLGFNEYEARISNRKFLEGLAESLEIPTDKFYGFSMSIDKLEKIGVEGVVKEMIEVRKIDEISARKSIDMINPEQFKNKSFKEVVENFRESVGKTQIGTEALDELLQIDEYLQNAKVESKFYRFDTTIARGLASYTGPVWEFSVIDGGVGSIAGCGRYDKAIGKYLGFDVPATGGSFGIERICEIIKDRDMLNLPKTPVQVLVAIFNESLRYNSLEVATKLRSEGVNAMLYPEVEKLAKQFKYADKKQIKFVVILGEDELNNNVVTLKNMQTGEQITNTIDFILGIIK
jgi:histidyl-tRNA synthetase